jgi:predicted nucleic-acid-binding Zn-ribbon protein
MPPPFAPKDKNMSVFADEDLLFTDVTEYFNAAGVSSTCPSCGYSKWTVIDAIDDSGKRVHPAFPLHNTDGVMQLAGANIPVVVVICNRCSYLKLYARTLIKLWVKNGKQPIAGG